MKYLQVYVKKVRYDTDVFIYKKNLYFLFLHCLWLEKGLDGYISYVKLHWRHDTNVTNTDSWKQTVASAHKMAGPTSHL